MHYSNQHAVQQAAQERYEAYKREAEAHRALSVAYPKQSWVSKARSYVARQLRRAANVIAADEPISAYDRA
jgi:ABC-type lipoprotein export system ATPase subunit